MATQSYTLMVCELEDGTVLAPLTAITLWLLDYADDRAAANDDRAAEVLRGAAKALISYDTQDAR